MKELLTRKLGPFPVGIWLIVIAGGLGIGLYSRRSFTDKSSTEEVDPTTTAGGTMLGGNTSGGANATQPGTGVNGLGGPVIGTNEEWYSWAYTQLVGRGFSNAGAIQAALSKFLQGQQLNDAEQRIVDAALQYGGLPPQLLPPVQYTPVSPVIPNPPTTPPTTPPTVPPPAMQSQTPIPTAQFSVSAPPVSSLIDMLMPGQGLQVVNPVGNDSSSVVVGRTTDGPGYIYGGSPEQAALLTGQQTISMPGQTVPSRPTIASQQDQIRALLPDGNLKAMMQRIRTGRATQADRQVATLLGYAA